jgi:hypothetical protein
MAARVVFDRGGKVFVQVGVARTGDVTGPLLHPSALRAAEFEAAVHGDAVAAGDQLIQPLG